MVTSWHPRRTTSLYAKCAPVSRDLAADRDREMPSSMTGVRRCVGTEVCHVAVKVYI